ncbi:MAG TPA: hypothetical protein PLW14_03180 [Chlorobiota bacterium]|nr:hypothetical protein [Chlorobiota bacterium]
MNDASLSSTAVEFAKQHIGICEYGYNRGPIISDIIRRGGGRDGDSWCAYFVTDMFRMAAAKTGIRSPLKRTGACWDLLKAATLPTSSLRILLPSSPGGLNMRAGDITIHARRATNRDLVGKQFLGHTEIVESDRGSTYLAIGGNTSCGRGSQYDGDCVCRKTRYKRSTTLPLIAVLRA